MKIIDVGDERFEVIREIKDLESDLVDVITKSYSEVYNDFKLIRVRNAPKDANHYLVCRKIDDAEVMDQ